MSVSGFDGIFVVHVMVHGPLPQFAKRDFLRGVEKDVQRRWEQDKVFEVDAPKVRQAIQSAVWWYHS